MKYLLIVSIFDLVGSIIGKKSLESIKNLDPQPDKIIVVNWSECPPDVVNHYIAELYRYVKRENVITANDLIFLKRQWWGEHKKYSKYQLSSGIWCPITKVKAWGLKKAVELNIPRVFYHIFGGIFQKDAFTHLNNVIENQPDASFSFLQIRKCGHTGNILEPTRYAHLEQRITGDNKKGHLFLPGMLMAADRINNKDLLNAEEDWIDYKDDELIREILISNGNGYGTKESYYDFFDRDRLGYELTKEYIRNNDILNTPNLRFNVENGMNRGDRYLELLYDWYHLRSKE